MITLEQAQAQLDAWLAASLALAAGKQHQIGDRLIRLEDGVEVRNQIGFWQRKVAALSDTTRGGSARYALADFSDD